ncbi:MAG: alpha/beta hydrolase [Phenylobacterium sp.]|jgi:acetyl esterase|uniref:alpha/beta hydrolase n=1 Tax=Phenylobacterium sp. TaxID=1871053 RepID=UPI001B444834|nr:alpha/beta hydrolase [Phenylobacterium sp.]MBP7649204.1 alpha/beta hydrolase [Phenylobacterium sp.]MBP7815370.1 alpha/beta hydrolase [Phenylobacterium sp.]MBP9753710.1 alpha/beta hydrolase [Phenylobacterium sp.]
MDPHIKAMLDAAAAAAAGQQAPPLDAIPPEMIRAGYRMQRQAQNLNAPKDVTASDIKVDGAEGPIPARLYVPAGAPAVTPLLVYYHGGGFAIGDLETHDGHCRRMAAYAGIRVLAIDYRLAPEHPFPAGHDDCLAATRWAFDHAAEIGVDPTRIAVGGCSAGGNLAASISVDMKNDPQRKIAFQLLLYPGIWPDVETQSRKDLDGPVLTKAAIAWFDKCLAALGHPQAHRAMLGRADVAGTPPALVITAGYDPLKDEGRDFAARLNAAGVKATHKEYADMVHDFLIMGDVSPAIDAAAHEIAAQLKAALS